MRHLVLLLSFAVAVLPASSSDSDSDSSYYGTVSDSGNFASGAGEALDRELEIGDAVGEVESSGSGVVDLGVAVLAPEAGGSDSTDADADAGGTGEAVFMGCMVTDAVPPVAHLPACGQVVADEDDSEEQEEDDSADSGQESGPDPVVITVTASDFAELPVAGPQVHLQPDRGWVLVNMDTVVYTSSAPQVLQTELLGVPVAVRATPQEFSWDFGDGADPVVTADAGRPWPDQTVAHAYTRAAADQVVTLHTTFTGEFRVAGQGPWIPIAGTVATTSHSDPFAVETRQTHLVGART